MHILLTDFLTCPRCGPSFGLIVLADRIHDRDIESGRLGCANCRETYAILEGVADLRNAAVPPLDLGPLPPTADDRVLRTAALLGRQPANATLLVVERDGSVGAQIGGMIREAHIVSGTPGPPSAAEGEGPPSAAEGEGVVSRLLVASRLPFRDASFHGVALLGTPTASVLNEGLRVLRGGGRIVVDGAVPGTANLLRGTGLDVYLDEGAVVVAATPGPR